VNEDPDLQVLDSKTDFGAKDDGHFEYWATALSSCSVAAAAESATLAAKEERSSAEREDQGRI